MQISKIGGYLAPKTNFNNQVKMSKPVTFGEHEWIGGMPDYKAEENKRLNRFYKGAKEFEQDSKSTIKRLKKLAQVAYIAGEKSDFREKDGTVKIDGVICDVNCTKGGKHKTVSLKNHNDEIKFYFDKDNEGIPKEYKIKIDDYDEKSIIAVKPDETKYIKDDKWTYGIKEITFNKKGYVYKEKSDMYSEDYKSITVGKFPHSARPVYESCVRWSWGDSKRILTLNPIKRSWDITHPTCNN